MNKWRLFGGVVCLALAALFGVLSEVLAAGSFVFMVDGVNRPYIPVIGLAVLGVALLFSAWKR